MFMWSLGALNRNKHGKTAEKEVRDWIISSTRACISSTRACRGLLEIIGAYRPHFWNAYILLGKLLGEH